MRGRFASTHFPCAAIALSRAITVGVLSGGQSSWKTEKGVVAGENRSEPATGDGPMRVSQALGISKRVAGAQQPLPALPLKSTATGHSQYLQTAPGRV